MLSAESTLIQVHSGMLFLQDIFGRVPFQLTIGISVFIKFLINKNFKAISFAKNCTIQQKTDFILVLVRVLAA